MSEGCTHLKDVRQRQAVTWKPPGEAPAPLPPGNSIVCWAGLAGKHGLSSASMAVRADPYFCPAFGVDNHED